MCSIRKNLQFTILTVFKHNGHWEVLGFLFKISHPPFEHVVGKFSSLISGNQFNLLAADFASEFTIKIIDTKHSLFLNFPEELYAVEFRL